MSTRWIQGLMLGTLVTVLTGCGQGFLGAGGSSESASTILANQADELAKIQSETESAEQAMLDAQQVLDGLIQNDQLTIPSAPGGLGLNLGSISGIPDRLRAILDKVYDKLVDSTARAKDLLVQARAKIVAAMGNLDPSDPQQAEMIAKLQQFLDRLDQLQGRLDVVYDLLADQVQKVVEKVDDVIAKIDTSKVWNMILVNELEAVRDVLIEFRDRLANT